LPATNLVVHERRHAGADLRPTSLLRACASRAPASASTIRSNQARLSKARATSVTPSAKPPAPQNISTTHNDDAVQVWCKSIEVECLAKCTI
jgi:hypothetical protein